MRKQGWEIILDDYITTQKAIPFVWGHTDCVLFAANCANAILEQDLSPQIAAYGDYDEAAALEYVRACNGIAGIFDRHFTRRPVKTAQRGDIVVMNFNGTKAAGICNGRLAVCKTIDGIIFVPMIHALAAWEVV